MAAPFNAGLGKSSVARRGLAQLVESQAFKGHQAAEEADNRVDPQPFLVGVGVAGVEGIVIGLGIDGLEDRSFIAADADHLAAPLGDVRGGRVDHPLDRGQQTVIVPLELGMLAGPTAEIQNKLDRADNRSGKTNPGGVDPRLQDGQDSACSQHDDREVEEAVPPFEAVAPCGVVERIAQHIESKTVFVHRYFRFGGGGVAGAAGCGCLGPGVAIGWRGPIELIDTPSLSFVIKIVSLKFAFKGMPGGGRRWRAGHCCQVYDHLAAPRKSKRAA